MPMIKLGIHKDYVPTWGVWEGVRDLVQNALDEDDKGHALEFGLRSTGNLYFRNSGSIIPASALSIGFSTKTDDDTQRGQYGEGLKLSMLALLREGKRVRIYTGDKTYTPEFVFDKQLDCEVLAIKVGKRKFHNNTEVVIEDMAKEWEGLRCRFTRWADFTDTAESYAGTLIKDAEAKGCLFVKGIFVCSDPNLEYGYDLKNCELDRDRSVPRQWDMEYATSRVLQSALIDQTVSGSEVLNMMTGDKTDSRHIGGMYVGSAVKSALMEAVKDAYPEADAYAYSASEASQAPPSVKVVTLPAKLKDTLYGMLPTVSDMSEKLRSVPLSLVDGLTQTQSAILTEVILATGLSAIRFANIKEGGSRVVLKPSDGSCPFIDIEMAKDDAILSVAEILSKIIDDTPDLSVRILSALIGRQAMSPPVHDFDMMLDVLD